MSQKVAYVTGGMGGIGTSICQRLAKEGFKVIRRLWQLLRHGTHLWTRLRREGSEGSKGSKGSEGGGGGFAAIFKVSVTGLTFYVIWYDKHSAD